MSDVYKENRDLADEVANLAPGQTHADQIKKQIAEADPLFGLNKVKSLDESIANWREATFQRNGKTREILLLDRTQSKYIVVDFAPGFGHFVEFSDRRLMVQDLGQGKFAVRQE